MPPVKQFTRGDQVWVDYSDEHYRAEILEPEVRLAGAWFVWRKTKHQLPEGWGIEDGRIETVSELFLSKIERGE